jgi:PAS domain S-box-containing protein
MDTEKRLKVLVIHHDTGASCAYTAIARSAGWEVSSCEETGDVVGALGDNDVDVLIFEFSPESGFEALRKGYTREEWLATPDFWFSRVHPDDREFVTADAAALAAGHGSVGGVVFRWLTKQDRVVWGETHLAAIRDQAGQMLGVRGVTFEVTDRKNAEAELLESKRFLQSALDALSAHIGILDQEGRILAVNAAWNRFAAINGLAEGGYGVGANYLEVCHHASGDCSAEASAVARGIREVIAQRVPDFQLEYPCHSSQEQRWFVVRVTRFAGEGPVRVVVAHENITVRKLAEEALREGEQRYRSLVEATTAIVWDTPSSGEFETEQARWATFTGQSFEEYRGWGWLNAIHHDDQAETARVWSAAVASRGIYEVEHRLRFRDHTYREMMVRAVPIVAENGSILQWVGIHTDITERKRAEAVLGDTAQRLQLATKLTGTGVWDWDVVTNRIVWDAQMFAIYGYDSAPPEFTYETWAATVLPEDLAAQSAILQETVRQRGRSERKFRICRVNDGAVRVIHAAEITVTGATGEPLCVVGINRDITELETAAANLAASEERFRQAFDFAGTGIAIVGLDGGWLRVNRTLCKIVGYPAEELLAKTFQEITHPEDLDADLAHVRELLEGKTLHYQMEKRYLHRDGHVVWIQLNASLVRDPVGAAMHFVAHIEDITERKRAESERAEMNRQLVDVSRQAGMAEVATSVLHNVGNVLNSVNVSATLVAEGVRKSSVGDLARVVGLLDQHPADVGDFIGRDPQGRKLPGFLRQLSGQLARERQSALAELQSLRENVEHIKDIVAMQQNYAKVSGVTEILQVADLVEDSLRMNATSLTRHEVELRRDYGEVPSISVEKHKVLQILVNLIRNAKHACDDAGRTDKQITIRVSNGHESVRVAVIDNGIGIPPENLVRIFNHGFTTRKNGHGFGLHNAVLTAREMGGDLTVHSDGPGAGATFTLELPLTASGTP